MNPEPRCALCGRSKSNHDRRHLFVAVTAEESPFEVDPAELRRPEPRSRLPRDVAALAQDLLTRLRSLHDKIQEGKANLPQLGSSWALFEAMLDDKRVGPYSVQADQQWLDGETRRMQIRGPL